MNLQDMRLMHWNTDLPPVDVPVLIAVDDGTIWKIQRDQWLESRRARTQYRCVTTGHMIDSNSVIGWCYP
jgi:hypothetical protein